MAIRRVRGTVGTIAQPMTTASQRLIQNPPPRQSLTSPRFPIPGELFVTGLGFRNRPGCPCRFFLFLVMAHIHFIPGGLLTATDF